MDNVFITQTSHFYPNEPVPNDEMEDYLGLVNNNKSLSRPIVLRNNGIKSRYYALDKQGNMTHSSIQMAANAIRGLEEEGFKLSDADVLAYGTASPEQFMPSPAAMVHGELPEAGNMEVVSFQGSCCTSAEALKYCCYALASGDADEAICAASERTSALLRAENFKAEGDVIALNKRPILAFEKDFLRWMLSDGAAAVRLSRKPAEGRLSLKVEWVELTSFANELETCMYLGAEKNADGTLRGWNMFPQDEWLPKSVFSLKQDTRLLGDNIVKLGGLFLERIMKKRNFSGEDVDWFLPHMSSLFFKDQMKQNIEELGLVVDDDHWFYNLPRIGNVGSVSALAMIDELYHSGKLKKGEHLLVAVPESARFTYGYIYLTVC
ncbi:MAG: beta-ketoacyl-ACP synthase III [Paludibacteraceae bacterium]|nr:beta-ketoacyl-ACP synthase III [Paludibacteraceae bacterium]